MEREFLFKLFWFTGLAISQSSSLSLICKLTTFFPNSFYFLYGKVIIFKLFFIIIIPNNFTLNIFGISGTLISVLLRIELYSSGNRIISERTENEFNRWKMSSEATNARCQLTFTVLILSHHRALCLSMVFLFIIYLSWLSLE